MSLLNISKLLIVEEVSAEIQMPEKVTVSVTTPRISTKAPVDESFRRPEQGDTSALPKNIVIIIIAIVLLIILAIIVTVVCKRNCNSKLLDFRFRLRRPLKSLTFLKPLCSTFYNCDLASKWPCLVMEIQKFKFFRLPIDSSVLTTYLLIFTS